MTSIVKHILGEAIPGSEDADVTADEFLDSGPRTIDHGNGVKQVFDEDGNEKWYKNGKLHRDGNLPAVVDNDGNQYWFKNGQRHRDGDLPAIIYADGYKAWYHNDKLHRNDGKPAVIDGNGTQHWY